jgi:molybdenum cofactor guanylyltransferase
VNRKGIVLAGGKSRRFGRDKALALFGGMTLIERALSLLQVFDSNPVVITSTVRDYSFLDCKVERDLVPDCGPLGGLYTACRLFTKSSLIVITCDMPNLTVEILKTLIQRHHSENKATFFNLRAGRLQPFPGVYESTLADLIERRIKSRLLSMQAFLRSVSQVGAVEGHFSLEAFCNVNTPLELEATYEVASESE